jgi:hypothetical protein
MPDAVMMLAYPAAKPLDTRGYITRLYAAGDVVVVLVPSAAVCAAEVASASGRGDPAPRVAAGDLGRQDVSAPPVTAVATETASAATRGV